MTHGTCGSGKGWISMQSTLRQQHWASGTRQNASDSRDKLKTKKATGRKKKKNCCGNENGDNNSATVLK